MVGFHPNDPYQCPKVHACPHLFGASLERTVEAANWHEDESLRLFHGLNGYGGSCPSDGRIEQLERELAETRRQLKELPELADAFVGSVNKELAETRRQLKELQRRRFHKDRTDEPHASAAVPDTRAEKTARKRGAPVGQGVIPSGAGTWRRY
jgi:hypothetical protein